MASTNPTLHLSAEDTAEITRSFNAIQKVLAKQDVNIEHVIGLVTTDEVSKAARQVAIKFAEETTAQMNMISFD